MGLDLSLIDQECILRELVKSFAKEYFYGGLKEHYNGVQKRVKNFSNLQCTSIDAMSNEVIIGIFMSLWSQGKRRKKHISKNVDNARKILKNLLCKKDDILHKDYLGVLRDLRVEGFSVSSLTEIASLLYPERFFILNKRVIEAIAHLSRKGIISTEDDYGKRLMHIDNKIISRLDDYLRRGRVSGETIERFRDIERLLGSILKYLKEIEPNANYSDADSFILFVDAVYELEVKGRGAASSYIIRILRKSGSSSDDPIEIFYKWLKQAKSVCNPYLKACEDDEKIVEMIAGSLRLKKQAVIYGVPGTGKTFIAMCVAMRIAGSRDRIELITFHPSYSYEDFVEGIRPAPGRTSKVLEFKVEDGVFKNIVTRATRDLLDALLDELKKLGVSKIVENIEKHELADSESASNVMEKVLTIRKRLYELGVSREELKKKISDAPKYVLVIDEINRGDVSRIFGELITLLENDKRLFEDNEIIVTLPYSKKSFFIPPNLYVIGTMNSTDRSIAFVDYALRRRFAFIELEPDPSKVPETVDGFELREFFKLVNEYLAKTMDRDHRLGHSYFMNVDNLEKLRDTWFTQIRPLLMEFFYGRDDEIKGILKDLYTKSFIHELEEFEKKLKEVKNMLEESIRRI